MTKKEVTVAPKTIEDTLLAIAAKQELSETMEVHITFTSELVKDICLRIRELENPSA